MTDDNIPPGPNEQAGQTKPEPSAEDAGQQRQASMPDAPTRRSQPLAPGRKPLFRS
jgi:hypothetical protein